MTHGQNASLEIDPRMDAYEPPCPETRFTNATAYEALVHAWDLLKLVLVRFWSPAQLEVLPAISQWRLYDCLDWLRPIEQMLRRLIFIEARALAPTLPAPKPPRPRIAKPRAPIPFLERRWSDPGRTDTWPVRFPGFQAARPGRPSHPRRPRDPFEEKIAPRDHKRMLSPWPLAYRLEAAIRVAVDPLPWIKRLAARLRRGRGPDLSRLGKPHRMRIRRAAPTLDALADILNMPRCRFVDSS